MRARQSVAAVRALFFFGTARPPFRRFSEPMINGRVPASRPNAGLLLNYGRFFFVCTGLSAQARCKLFKTLDLGRKGEGYLNNWSRKKWD